MFCEYAFMHIIDYKHDFKQDENKSKKNDFKCCKHNFIHCRNRRRIVKESQINLKCKGGRKGVREFVEY